MNKVSSKIWRMDSRSVSNAPMWLMLGRTDRLSMMDWAISKGIGDEVQAASEWSFMINDSFYIYSRWMKRHVPWMGWDRSTMDGLIINVKELSSDDVKGHVSSRDAWKWLWQIKVESWSSQRMSSREQVTLVSTTNNQSWPPRWMVWASWWGITWHISLHVKSELIDDVEICQYQWLMQVIMNEKCDVSLPIENESQAARN